MSVDRLFKARGDAEHLPLISPSAYCFLQKTAGFFHNTNHKAPQRTFGDILLCHHKPWGDYKSPELGGRANPITATVHGFGAPEGAAESRGPVDLLSFLFPFPSSQPAVPRQR